jgi:hypothetical protein
MIRNYQRSGGGGNGANAADLSRIYASIDQLQIQLNDIYTRTVSTGGGGGGDIPPSIMEQFIRLSNSVTGVISSVGILNTDFNSLFWDVRSIHQSTDILSTDMRSMSQYMDSLGQSINDLSTKITGGGSSETSTIPTLYNITIPGTYSNPISYQKSAFSSYSTFKVSNISAPTIYFDDIYFYGPGGFSWSGLSADTFIAHGMCNGFYNCSFGTLLVSNNSHNLMQMDACSIGDFYMTRPGSYDTEWTNEEAIIERCHITNVSYYVSPGALSGAGVLRLDDCTVHGDVSVNIPYAVRSSDSSRVGISISSGNYKNSPLNNCTLYNADIYLYSVRIFDNISITDPLKYVWLNKVTAYNVTLTAALCDLITCSVSNMDVSHNMTNSSMTMAGITANHVNCYCQCTCMVTDCRFANGLDITASVVTGGYNDIGYLRALVTQNANIDGTIPYRMITAMTSHT